MHFDTENMQSEFLIKLHKTMLKIRKAEEKIAELVYAGEIRCPCHLYIGQEAVATGACAALELEDYMFSNYRGHGHYLAKGGDLNKMMAEVYGKVTGCSKGRGGSMHLISPEVSIVFGSSAIVAGHLAPAVGSALASQLANEKRVSLVFFGDGATDEGVFSEVVNFAALKKLPIVFICENNLYASHFRLDQRQPLTDLYLRTQPMVPSFQVDGNNVIEVFIAAKNAVELARSGGGPTFIECLTYRHRGHVGPNPDVETVVTTTEERPKWANLNPVRLAERATRSRKELEKWLERDPITEFKRHLIKNSIIDEKSENVIQSEIDTEIRNAITFAENSEYPKPEELNLYVYSE